MSLESIMMKDVLTQVATKPFEVEYAQEPAFIVGEGSPQFKIHFKDKIAKTALLQSTSIALGEAYMNGSLEIEGDLFEVLDSIMGNLDKFHTDHKALKKIISTSSSLSNQKKEVQSHYDIGNDFYQLWLDETLSYSCGYFKNEDDSLHQAQVNKVDLILKKLNLKQDMTLLDIGCGWGYLLIKAAKEYGIKGVGITLSEEQHKEFQRRIDAEGLKDKLEVRLMDYRDLAKSGLRFDRVVSVGMIEHVGRDNYQLFMENVENVLEEKGVFLLHYISALQEHPGDAWIKKYIFPGGTVPSLREIINIAGDNRFYTIDIESLRRHYKKTLLCWLSNFRQHTDAVKEMFDDQFVHMWELYLCACAASFNNGVIDLHQILFTKGANNDLPMTREYMTL